MNVNDNVNDNVNENDNENVNENEMYFLLKLENERMYTRIKQLENANFISWCP